MADAMVERRPTVRFFCHRCNVEFEDVLQDYTCPYCASGFIEQLENEGESLGLSGDDFSDADMSNIDDLSNIDDNLDDSDELHQLTHGTPPMLNDLAFLMSGGRLRGPGRRDTLMEQLVWMIGGARPGSGAVTAGAPFVLVGAPGDYVFGGEGLDAVVTQLLGQLENTGPPPLPRDRIAALPTQTITADQTAANAACSVCWENFQLDEIVSRLECDHIFHPACISPWLQLHATCPICRRSLLPDEPADAASDVSAPSDGALSDTTAPSLANTLSHTALSDRTATPAPSFITSQESLVTPASFTVNTPMFRAPMLSHVVVRRLAPDSSGSSARTGTASGTPSTVSMGSSVTASGVWAPSGRDSDTTSTSTTSVTSDRDRDRNRQYNMDIDYD